MTVSIIRFLNINKRERSIKHTLINGRETSLAAKNCKVAESSIRGSAANIFNLYLSILCFVYLKASSNIQIYWIKTVSKFKKYVSIYISSYDLKMKSFFNYFFMFPSERYGMFANLYDKCGFIVWVKMVQIDNIFPVTLYKIVREYIQ